MTSATDTAQHPEVSEISDLAEGLLTASRAAEVRRHLSECELCAEVRDSLEEIRGLLGTLPDPEPMPEDIAARIDAALAAEARSDAGAGEPADASGAAAVSRDADVSRETENVETSDASSVTPRTGSSPDRPAGRSQGATGPGRRTARRRRRAVILGTACGAALIGMSVLFLQNLSSSQNASDASADRAVSASESGAHSYSQDTLEAEVQGLLAGGASTEKYDGQKQSPSTDERAVPEAETPDTTTSRNPLSAPAVDVPPACSRRPAAPHRPSPSTRGPTRGRMPSSSSSRIRAIPPAYRPMWSPPPAWTPLPGQPVGCCSQRPTTAPEDRYGTAGMHHP